MQTRRAFLKLLLGTGALILPWTTLPTQFREALRSLSGTPRVHLLLPPPPPLPMPDHFIPESLKRTALEDVAALASPAMEGRRAGLLGEGRASQYLIQQLREMGLSPMGEGLTSFTQTFTVPAMEYSKVNDRLVFVPSRLGSLRIPSMNILGRLVGVQEDRVILLSAHYDHLGTYQGTTYPGANDNASGVACMLDVMRKLLREKISEGRQPKKTVALAFWSAEEMGFLGSKAFLKEPTLPIRQIEAVINGDTLGNGMVGDFALWSDDEGNLAYRTIRQAAKEAGAVAELTPRRGHNSDQSTFAQGGIPAVTLTTRDWLRLNHTPQDDLDNIKREQLQLAVDIVYRAVKQLAY